MSYSIELIFDMPNDLLQKCNFQSVPKSLITMYKNAVVKVVEGLTKLYRKFISQ